MPHTQTESNLTPFPYFNKTGVVANRILVKPDETPERTHESGLLIPENAGKVCETGVVVSVCEGSEFKPGDVVLYKVIQRGPETDSIFIEYQGETHHMLFENEIWSCNEVPVNTIFIEPIPVTVGSEGIIIPDETMGALQYGVVKEIPVRSIFKVGDVVGYNRNPEVPYPTATLNDVLMQVLFERDVFVVNGKVSPYRIIVKIDKVAQHKHQSQKENGILLHQSFMHMKRNLQYGRVMQIGAEAQKMYPMVKDGDYISFHHFIEHHPYRLIGTKRNADGNVTSEYRILNCFEHDSREVFAKLNVHINSVTKKLTPIYITSTKGDYFCDWRFDMFHEMFHEVKSTSEFDTESFDFDITKIHDLEELRAYIDRKKTATTEKYKSLWNKYTTPLGQLNPADPSNTTTIAYYESQVEELKRSVDAISGPLNRNYPVVCKVSSIAREIDAPYPYIVTTYKEMYPIPMMGKRYLIVDKNFIHGYLKNKQMPHDVEEFIPFGDRVLIEPVIEDRETQILIPEGSALERPVKGIVVAVGPGTDKVQMIAKVGMEVYFKKMGNAELKFGDTTYFSMIQNDLLGGFPVAF